MTRQRVAFARAARLARWLGSAWLLVLGAAPGWATPPPSDLARLAAGLVQQGAAAQTEFALLALDALLEAYAAELAAADRERPASAAQRDKLRRWRRGTAELVATLEAAHAALAEGAPVTLLVDAQHQVMLVVAGRVLVVSGPRAEADTAIERQVLARFCAFNDCSWLGSLPDPGDAAGQAGWGVWELGQAQRPRYIIDGGLWCEFADLGERRRKAAACERLAAELDRLARELGRAVARGEGVDWALLAATPPRPGQEQVLPLRRDGGRLRLQLPSSARLEVTDWERVVDWLSVGGFLGVDVLQVLDADRLLR